MSLSVVLLAANEEENLKLLLPKIIEKVNETKEEYEIIVVDTENSSDDTKGVCQLYGAKYINQEEPYFIGAYKAGIKHAKFEKFLILDCDGSHPPEKITEVYKMFTEENCDVVIGSRYVKGGETNDFYSSRIMSKILNNTYRICLNIKANDLSSGFRMYHSDQLKNINLSCKHFDLMSEILIKLRDNKPDLKIGEVPICFNKRMYGKSKRNLIVFILSFIKSLLKWTTIRFITMFNTQRILMKK